ncbi:MULTISPECIES: GerMN domain-containing protein [unclassified Fusibacter]|uniref:GerMN domain-containing protein n=1 Tax=unclassified Fusibacter TaxID=2624464 RepID=UPI001012990F|nr:MULTISPECIES: hypothetical protein [unclassified Fusibacter]MCK8061050.1 hypothetical protein [Fusibacter sp. A2]NPE20496.1 hypothetical protein [Fusibacter sp. A1]RXV63696.1 hypothetical protein DWB64_01595 [Fusibacter sp. A1]
MKRIMTLLIYVLLIYTVYVIPINTTAFEIDFSSIFAPDETAEEIAEDPIHYSMTPLTTDDYFIAPNEYAFAVDTNRPIGDTELSDLAIELVVQGASGMNKSYGTSELTITHTKKDTRYVITVAIDQSSLSLGHENYMLTITASISDQVLKNEFSTFYPDDMLKPNGLSADQVTTELAPFYYPDENNLFNIPVYTKMESGSNYFRRILNTLYVAPSLPGISNESAFPYSNYVWYSAGLLELKFSESSLENYTTQEAAKLSLSTLIKTLESSSRDTIVNKVRMLVNGSQNSQAFGGLDLTTEFVVNREPKVYLPLLSHDSTIWLPFDIASDDDIYETANRIISAYKSPTSYTEDERITTLIPDSLNLVDAQLVSETLQLKFSANIRSMFGDRRDYVNTLLEGLSLSMTSIPYVEQIEFYVGTERLSSLGPINFEVPLTRPDYFNVDPKYVIE